MNSKLFGSILLIVGTSIGGGMLALPIATASLGFFNATILLGICWFLMTASALLILEVNLWLPDNTNLISMAKLTLGKTGAYIAWLAYLLLLYSLLAAYIAGGGEYLQSLLAILHILISNNLAAVIFAIFLGYIVIRGISSVDIVNRLLMLWKLGAFFLLIILILPHVSPAKLIVGDFHFMAASITVAITSFGFATIVPSLRTYFQGDIKKIRFSIILGSFIPLVCYVLWIVAIMGVMPQTGENGLLAMFHSNTSTGQFVFSLSEIMHNSLITIFVKIFTSICLATSFLGVALCLSDFLFDGLKISKNSSCKFVTYMLTFIPPLLIVLFYPGVFITALSYAGIYCVILLMLLPALMAWSGRYRKNILADYKVRGGKVLLIILICAAVLIISYGLISIRS